MFRWNFTSEIAGFPCPEDTRKYTWNGAACLHDDAFWHLPEHRGDPWLQTLPKMPDWGRLSSGVHVERINSKRAMNPDARIGVDNESQLSEHPDRMDYSKLATTTEAEHTIEQRLPSFGSNATENSLVRLPTEGKNGPYRFDYCTKNNLEAHLITVEGRLVSNQAASRAWIECKSGWPVVHTEQYSKAAGLCPNGGRSVVWYGRDCFHTTTFYNSQPFADDPYLTHRHQKGCGSGIHARLWH